MGIGTNTDPVEIAASATRAGLFQDIVIATSRYLHDQELSTKDRKALGKGIELLKVAANSEAVLHQSATRELSDASATLAVLRAAGTSAAEAGYFEMLKKAISRALKGDRSAPVVKGAVEARQLFLAVNEGSLNASIRNEQESPSTQLPIPSTANLRS